MAFLRGYETQLASDLSNTDTEMEVLEGPPAGVEVPFTVLVEAEEIRVGAVSGTTLSDLTRTAPVGHNSRADVDRVFVGADFAKLDMVVHDLVVPYGPYPAVNYLHVGYVSNAPELSSYGPVATLTIGPKGSGGMLLLADGTVRWNINNGNGALRSSNGSPLGQNGAAIPEAWITNVYP